MGDDSGIADYSPGGTRQQGKRASRHWNAVDEAKNRRARRQMERA